MEGTGLNNFPQFGVLAGVKVLVCGGAIAGPFGATLLGETGAEVVHFESPKNPDSTRGHYGYSQNHRNQISMVADMKTEEGLGIFKKLIRWTDIFIESSKGGTYEKMGLTDEVLWELNPRLVIVHVSGFGQTGVPDYITRASYDAVGQAFSGYMSFNGTPEEALKVTPYLSDYVTALNTCWTALAAYIHALRTGKGESVDVAQYESLARILDTRPIEYFTDGKEFPRTGNKDSQAALFSFYTCKDGGTIFIGMNGYGPVHRGYPLIGLPKPGDGDPEIDQIISGWMADTDLGRRLEAAMEKFVSEHTVDEVEKIMLENQIPCQKVYSFKDCSEDPQWKAREVFAEWDDVLGITRNISASFFERGIRCNCILPCNIKTEINRAAREKHIGILDWQMRAGNAAPMHTITPHVENAKPILGQPDDCANIITFLADDAAARYISGAEVKVDAGFLNM